MNRYKFDISGFDTFIVSLNSNDEISCDNSYVVDCFNKLKQSGIIGHQFCVHMQLYEIEGKLVKLVFVKIKTDDFSMISNSYYSAVKHAIYNESKNIFVTNTKFSDSNLNIAVVYGSLSSLYSFDKYKSDSKKVDIKISFDNSSITNDELKEAYSYYNGTSFCKDLVNEPANVLTPIKLTEIIRDKCKGIDDISLKIYDKKEIEKFGMSAFLEVSKGSNNNPYLIVLNYNTDKTKDKLALVGKGLTFDSGGFSLKPSEGMGDMKTDMAGAAAVASCIIELAKNKVKANVVGIIAACENIISSKAYKPGDVISSMLKKTIEIDNTDAEGRLTLADAVTYAVEKEEAKEIITIATLTGAAIRCLGKHYTCVISKEHQMYDKLLRASNEVGDKVWLMPYDEVFKLGLESKIADIKNTGDAYAGMISAGMFIESFCKNTPLLHLDIAGTSWSTKSKSIKHYGATGVGVNMLYRYVKNGG